MKSMENIIEKTKAEQFCDDLISFDDAKPKSEGHVMMSFQIQINYNLI